MRSLLIPALFLALVGFGAAPGGTGKAVKAPDFVGGGPWFNTGGKALAIADLRGKVIAVEMWTGGCINCINTLPYVKEWDAKYRAKGLVVVGVHSPEFQHEHAQPYVQQAIAKRGIKYPVVMDNDFRIWDAYRNAYWPTLYLVDKHGVIRYKHIGEGEYDTTERTIARLLAEPN
jgi:thiol-disulfide isomerase/thioredoxin